MTTPGAVTLEELRELRGEVHQPPRPRRRAQPKPSTAGDLLAAGAVEVIERTTRTLVAEVEGRTGIRRHVEVVAGRWSCTCPAFTYRRHCAHVNAVRLVAAEPGYRRLKPDTARTAAGLELTQSGDPHR